MGANKYDRQTYSDPSVTVTQEFITTVLKNRVYGTAKNPAEVQAKLKELKEARVSTLQLALQGLCLLCARNPQLALEISTLPLGHTPSPHAGEDDPTVRSNPLYVSRQRTTVQVQHFPASEYDTPHMSDKGGYRSAVEEIFDFLIKAAAENQAFFAIQVIYAPTVHGE